MTIHVRLKTPTALLVRAALLSAAVLGVLQLLHGHLGEVHPLPPLLHWGRDAALALPIGLLAVWACAGVTSRTTGGPVRRALSGGRVVMSGAGAILSRAALGAAAQWTATASMRLDLLPFGIRERHGVKISHCSGRDGCIFGWRRHNGSGFKFRHSVSPLGCWLFSN